MGYHDAGKQADVLSASSGHAQPVLGVVIPAYGHPQFLAESIESVLRQDIDDAIALVIVDDGCKFSSTAQAARPTVWARGGRVHYLRQRNHGLSAARNAGADHLLACYPQMQAIFFLDADNRLEEYALRSYWQKLRERPDAGWCYPDVFLFGLVGDPDGVRYHEVAPDYSVLTHLVDNICEAGSLVRTELFRKGIRFDESMRSGYEDWDFWLQAIQAGFRGIGVRDSGFLYRRRPESMVAESNRKRAELLAYLQRKHRKLYDARAVARLEQFENPRFAVIRMDREEVELTSDTALAGRRMGVEAFSQDLSAWIQRPDESFFPSVLLFISGDNDALNAAASPYARWLLWWVSGQQSAPLALVHPQYERAPDSAHVWALPSELLRLRGSSAIDLPEVVISLPEAPRASASGPGHHIRKDAIKALLRGHPAADGPAARMTCGRRYSGPPKSKVRSILQDRLELEHPAFPLVSVQQQGFGAALLAAPAEVSTAAGSIVRQLLQSFADLQLRSSLLALSPVRAPLATGLRSLFENLIPLVHQPARATQMHYLGRPMDHIGTPQRDELLSIAAPFDLIVALDTPWLASIFGHLRGLGLVCASVVGRTAAQDSEEGHVLRGTMVAYEHSHDAFLCEDDSVAVALVAEGVPAEKLLALDGTAQLRALLQSRKLD